MANDDRKTDRLSRLENLEATPSTMSFPSVSTATPGGITPSSSNHMHTPSSTTSLLMTNTNMNQTHQTDSLPELNGPFEMVTILSESLLRNLSSQVESSTRRKGSDDATRVQTSSATQSSFSSSNTTNMMGSTGLTAAVAAAAAMSGAAEAVTAGFAKLKGSSSMLFAQSTRASETSSVPSGPSQATGVVSTSKNSSNVLSVDIPNLDKRRTSPQSRIPSPSRSTQGSPQRSPAYSHSHVIQSIEICGSDLYIGFTDGLLGYYTLSLTVSPKQARIEASLQRALYMTNTMKRIDTILAVPTESTLLVLADGTISFYKLSDLSPATNSKLAPLKGVACVCADRQVQSPLPITIARRRGVVPAFLDHTLRLDREIPVTPMEQSPTSASPNHVIQMVQYGSSICAADSEMYKLIDTRRKQVLPLFPYDQDMMRPSMTAVGKGEFLLVTSSSVGMGIGVFISSKGEPIRGTLQWNGIPVFVGFHFPYLIAVLNTHTVQVHDIHSQDLVQTIVLPPDTTPTCLATASYPLELQEVYEDQSAVRLSPPDITTAERDVRPGGIVQVVIGLKDRVLGLKMIPWETQAEQLLELGRVNQALNLTHRMLNREGGAERKEKWLNSFYLRSAIGLLEQLDFRNAFELLRQADFNVNGLIRIYFESCSDWVEKHPESDINSSSFAIADIFYQFLERWDSMEGLIRKRASSRFDEVYKHSKVCLMDYLEYIYHVKKHTVNQITTTALVFLYAEFSNHKLVSLLATKEETVFPILHIVENTLLAFERYHGLALMYQHEGKLGHALDIWLKIASGDVTDLAYPGISLIVEVLTGSSDKKLIFRCTKSLLIQYPQSVIDIFTQRRDELFDTDEVLAHLESHGSRVSRKYLEFLIHEKRLQEPEFHKKLVLYSLEDIIALSDGDVLKELDDEYQNAISPYHETLQSSSRRKTFAAFLSEKGDPLCQARLAFTKAVRESAPYLDLSHLLLKLDACQKPLSFEKVSILTLRNQHENVLRTLILEMKDTTSAELYCQSLWMRNNAEQRMSKKKALNLLLMTYFEGMKTTKNNIMTPEITYLLMKYGSDIDVQFVLEQVPDDWNLQSILPIVDGAQRDQRRVLIHTLIQKSLYQATHTRAAVALNDLIAGMTPIYLPQEPLRVCSICEKNIWDPKLFVKRPSGDIVHLQCEHRITSTGKSSS